MRQEQVSVSILHTRLRITAMTPWCCVYRIISHYANCNWHIIAFVIHDSDDDTTTATHRTAHNISKILLCKTRNAIRDSPTVGSCKESAHGWRREKKALAKYECVLHSVEWETKCTGKNNNDDDDDEIHTKLTA